MLDDVTAQSSPHMEKAAGAARPRRILWLLDSLTMGGAEGLVVPFAKEIDRSRWELLVCCLSSIRGNPIEAEVRGMGVPTANVCARRLFDRQAFRRLEDFVRSERVDLVHAHLTYASIWSAMLTRRTGIPSIASIHVAPSATRKLNRSRLHAAATTVRDALMRVALRRWSSQVVVVSRAVGNEYQSLGGKMRVVRNGVDVAAFDRNRALTRRALEREFGIPPGVPLLVSVAVLRPGKGIEVLLEAMRSIPDAVLLIAGDGPERGRLGDLAISAGVESRIRWAGFRRDLDRLLAGCDVMVHPSLDDAFPTVLLEGMAAALPVVASRVGGIPEIVRDGVTGTLVPPGDTRLLADAIRNLLRDRRTAAALGAAGREVAREEFSTEAWLRRLTTVYEDVLASSHARAKAAPQ